MTGSGLLPELGSSRSRRHRRTAKRLNIREPEGLQPVAIVIANRHAWFPPPTRSPCSKTGTASLVSQIRLSQENITQPVFSGRSEQPPNMPRRLILVRLIFVWLTCCRRTIEGSSWQYHH